MNKPTDEQIKEFWERYKFTRLYEWLTPTSNLYGKSPDGMWFHIPITSHISFMGFLFEHTVPLAVNRIMLELGTDYDDALHSLIHDWMVLMRGKKDPALALFWALWQIKEGN